MMTPIQRSLCGALLAVPLMLGNRGCERQSAADKADSGANAGDSSAGRTTGSDTASGAEPDTVDDASTTNGKLATCEDTACGALPAEAPRCDGGSEAFPSCIKHADTLCSWQFSCGGVDTPEAGDAQAHADGVGDFCGGLAGVRCQDGQYCDFGGTCGAGDQGGVCAKVTDACSQDYAPVCGCDDKTYSNACTAAAASVSVVRAGECSDPIPCDHCTGPQPGAPNVLCQDGVHLSGPACVVESEASCGWQFLRCP